MHLPSLGHRRGHLERGFTLIELLVVIAIIGILSSVVLASLNTARNKGTDAAIKGNLSSARAEAEIFYDTNSSYDGVCATTGNNVIGDSVNAADVAFDGTAPTYADATGASTTGGACHDSSAGWAAMVPLKAGNYFCVDSTGKAAVVTTAMGTTGVACP
jgi:prepilin-type N-terminal cleavage/methylation domain-containing protein